MKRFLQDIITWGLCWARISICSVVISAVLSQGQRQIRGEQEGWRSLVGEFWNCKQCTTLDHWVALKKKKLCARRRKPVFILEWRSTPKCNALLVSQRHFCSSSVEYKYDLLHLVTLTVSSERRKWGCRGVRISASQYSTGSLYKKKIKMCLYYAVKCLSIFWWQCRLRSSMY